jgi:hypothetical protein
VFPAPFCVMCGFLAQGEPHSRNFNVSAGHPFAGHRVLYSGCRCSVLERSQSRSLSSKTVLAERVVPSSPIAFFRHLAS